MFIKGYPEHVLKHKNELFFIKIITFGTLLKV